MRTGSRETREHRTVRSASGFGSQPGKDTAHSGRGLCSSADSLWEVFTMNLNEDWRERRLTQQRSRSLEDSGELMVVGFIIKDKTLVRFPAGVYEHCLNRRS